MNSRPTLRSCQSTALAWGQQPTICSLSEAEEGRPGRMDMDGYLDGYARVDIAFRASIGHRRSLRARYGPRPLAPSRRRPRGLRRRRRRRDRRNASLESVMVERENVVMEGENRSHGGGSDDDQTLGSHSQRHPRVRTLQQQKHVDLIFTFILGTWHAASCLRI